MNLKKLYSFIIILVTLFVLTGCNKDNNEIKHLLDWYKNLNAIDMDIEITSESFSVTEYVKLNNKVRKEGDNFYSVISEKYDARESVLYYFVNDYSYNVRNGYFSNMDVEYEKNGLNYFKINFNKLKYKTTKVEEKDFIKYSIRARGNVLKDDVLKLTGITLTKMPELIVEVNVDYKTRQIKEMKLIYTYELISGTGKTEVKINVNKMNKSVNFEIPSFVLIEIEIYEDERIEPFPNKKRKTVDQIPDIVTKSNKLNTLETTYYTNSICDENYIYTVNQRNYVLNVYDIETLDNVYSERLNSYPIAMDAYNGKFAIGFSYYLKIYDTTNWKGEIVETKSYVISTRIYKDLVFYGEVNAYNMTTKTHEQLFKLSYDWNSLIINRDEDTLYYTFDYYCAKYNFNTDTLEHFNVRAYKALEFWYDGSFLHINNNIYDKTGNLIAISPISRIYNIDGLKVASTIYDDNSISIVLGKRNENYVTVVYSLLDNVVLYEFEGTSTSATKVNNKFIIFDNSSNIIRTLDSNL